MGENSIIGDTNSSIPKHPFRSTCFGLLCLLGSLLFIVMVIVSGPELGGYLSYWIIGAIAALIGSLLVMRAAFRNNTKRYDAAPLDEEALTFLKKRGQLKNVMFVFSIVCWMLFAVGMLSIAGILPDLEILLGRIISGGIAIVGLLGGLFLLMGAAFCGMSMTHKKQEYYKWTPQGRQESREQLKKWGIQVPETAQTMDARPPNEGFLQGGTWRQGQGHEQGQGQWQGQGSPASIAGEIAIPTQPLSRRTYQGFLACAIAGMTLYLIIFIEPLVLASSFLVVMIPSLVLIIIALLLAFQYASKVYDTKSGKGKKIDVRALVLAKVTPVPKQNDAWFNKIAAMLVVIIVVTSILTGVLAYMGSLARVRSFIVDNLQYNSPGNYEIVEIIPSNITDDVILHIQGDVYADCSAYATLDITCDIRLNGALVYTRNFHDFNLGSCSIDEEQDQSSHATLDILLNMGQLHEGDDVNVSLSFAECISANSHSMVVDVYIDDPYIELAYGWDSLFGFPIIGGIVAPVLVLAIMLIQRSQFKSKLNAKYTPEEKLLYRKWFGPETRPDEVSLEVNETQRVDMPLLNNPPAPQTPAIDSTEGSALHFVIPNEGSLANEQSNEFIGRTSGASENSIADFGFCGSCGSKLPEKSEYCPECGEKL